MTLFSDLSFGANAPNDASKVAYLDDLLLVKKDKLNNDENSNKRMIAFNESYRKKQGDYLWLLLYVFIALVIFALLYAVKMFFPVIPTIVMDILYVNLFAFLLLFIAIKIYYIQQRSKMNYDKVEIPSNVPKPGYGNNNLPGQGAQDLNMFGRDAKDFAGDLFTFTGTDPSEYYYANGMCFISYTTSPLTNANIKAKTNTINIEYIGTATSTGKIYTGSSVINTTSTNMSYSTASAAPTLGNGSTLLTSNVANTTPFKWLDGRIYNSSDTDKIVIGFVPQL